MKDMRNRDSGRNRIIISDRWRKVSAISALVTSAIIIGAVVASRPQIKTPPRPRFVLVQRGVGDLKPLAEALQPRGRIVEPGTARSGGASSSATTSNGTHSGVSRPVETLTRPNRRPATATGGAADQPISPLW